MWVSYMAFVFDLNFKSSYLFIRENDYIHRNMERLHFTGDLKEDMLFVEKHVKVILKKMYVNKKDICPFYLCLFLFSCKNK